MNAISRPIKETLLEVIGREFRPLRFAQEMLARASGKTPRAARNWLDGRCTPDAEALIELMASCNSIADEVERLVAERRKARGCIAGVPDMQFTHAGRALYVEIKTPTGTVSKEQRALHKRLKSTGAPVAVCRCLDDVIGFLSREGISLRGEVMA